MDDLCTLPISEGTRCHAQLLNEQTSELVDAERDSGSAYQSQGNVFESWSRQEDKEMARTVSARHNEDDG